MKNYILIILSLHFFFCTGQEQDIKMEKIRTLQLIVQIPKIEKKEYFIKRNDNVIKLVFNKAEILNVVKNDTVADKDEVSLLKRKHIVNLIKNHNSTSESSYLNEQINHYFFDFIVNDLIIDDLIINDFVENDKVEIYLNNNRINELVLFKREESYYERSDNPFESYSSYYTYHVFKTREGEEILSALIFGSEE